MDTAWSVLTIKSLDDEKRIIEGIASTPEVDRVGDVIEPRGAKYALPMPLLWQHDKDRPIGHVVDVVATDTGIYIRARIDRGLDFIDHAWELVKRKLVRGLSIGFRSIDFEPLRGGGLRYKSWEWLELSAVTIPANQTASITTIKALDRHVRAVTHETSMSTPASLPRLTEIVAPTQRGLGLTRYALALIRGEGSFVAATVHAEAQKHWHTTPLVADALKSAVSAGSTSDGTWAGPLSYRTLSTDFIGAVESVSALGRIASATRRVPLKTRVPRQTSIAAAAWVAEAGVKVADDLAFDTAIMGAQKMAVVAVITNELARSSAPSAETVVKNDLVAACSRLADSTFFSASAATSAAPAGIAFSTSTITSTGNINTDAATAIAQLATAGSELVAPYWIGRPNIVAKVAAANPTAGGTLMGYPVIASTGAPSATLVLIDAGEVLLSADDSVHVSISEQADLDLGGGKLTSLFQLNLVGILVERFLSWMPARSAARTAAMIVSIA